MEIDEKLKLLRKVRTARPKGKMIEKTWEELDKITDLSIKEKLERLISLTRVENEKKEGPGTQEPPARKPFHVFENHYPLSSRYGKITLSQGLEIEGKILSLLSRDKDFEKLDLSGSLFLDLETTGLSGGVGIVPFLTGLGFFRENQFHVLQFFLGDLAEEEGYIKELGRFFEGMGFRSVVTFNGKGFDLPLLETRFILHRESFPLGSLPHLDFLFSARNLWRHKHESCRLSYLAREMLLADRAEDIPSAEIPPRYFHYLRTDDFSLIEPILYHNQEDILSLLGVVIAGARLFADKGEDWADDLIDSWDIFGAANLLEKRGEAEKSALYFQRALEGKLSGELAILAKRKLSYYFKKNQDWEKAISLWQEMSPLNQLFCHRELAMYYEHKLKDYAEAKRIAEEGLALSMGVDNAYEKDFSHRLERLKIKLRRLKKTSKKE